jgi:hypothetical protein
VTIYSDPWNAELPGSQSAQGGIPAQRIIMVENGILKNLIYNRYWAKEKKVEPTPGPVNTLFQTSGSTFLVHSLDGPAYRQLDRPHAGRRLDDRERKDRLSAEEFSL